MNQYSTQIFEMHSMPGGECTSWQRKDYIFDGCIHWLCGVNPDKPLNRLWKEVGALINVPVVHYDVFVRIEDSSGKALNVYSDIGRFEEHLIDLSPQDKVLIQEMARAVRTSTKFLTSINKPQELYNILDTIKSFFNALPFLPDLIKYGKISINRFAQKFQDPFLKMAFTRILPPESAATGLIGTLGYLHAKEAGYPIGGSLQFSKSIEKKYIELGGKIDYKSKIDKIIIMDGKAIGVKLANGEEHFADIVISAADGHATIYDMLEGKYINPKIDELYNNSSKYRTFTSLQVSLGIDCDLSDQPHFIKLNLDSPVSIDGLKFEYIPIKHYCYDRTLCSKGKSVITSLIDTPYGYWENLYKTPDTYKEQKQKAANLVTSMVEKRFPAAKGNIEVVDVATPMTYKRYANAWKGAYMPWIITPEVGVFNVPKTLPGLENFYMAGQWSMPPGGLPSALLSARGIIQILCHNDGKKFNSLVE